MNRQNLIVDMHDPTPIDSYRYKSVGEINIYYSKNLSSAFSMTIVNSEGESNTIDNVATSILNVWNLIEAVRSSAYDNRKTVNVVDENSKTTYKRLTLANTLSEIEKAEALERQAKRIKATRRRMVVDNKYHSRKRKKVSPRVLRPILREEKTW